MTWRAASEYCLCLRVASEHCLCRVELQVSTVLCRGEMLVNTAYVVESCE